MMFDRIITRLQRILSSLRRRYLSYRYASIFRISTEFLQVSGKCDFRIEGACSIGSLYLRSKDHNRIEIAVLKGAQMSFGRGVVINQGARLVATTNIRIGDDVYIGDDAVILDGDFHGLGELPPKSEPIEIGNGAWIASRAIVLKGVVIGEGSVIGAGAVVTKSIPPHSVAVGNPAKVVRYLK